MLLAKLKKLFKRRGSKVDQQPIEEDQKHSSYFVIIMAEMRVARYFLTAEDVTKLIQTSTLKLCSIIKLWRGSTVRKFELLKIPDEDQLTQIGRWVIQTGQVFGQSKGPSDAASWSMNDAEYLRNFEDLIPLAKDAAKLRRKLGRISDTFIVDLKKLKILVETHLDLVEEGKDTTTTTPGPTLTPMTSGMEPVSSVQYIKMRLKDAIRGGNQSRPNAIFDSMDVTDTKNSSKSTPTRRSYFDSSHAIDLKTPSANPSMKHLQRIADEFGSQPLSGDKAEAVDKQNPSVEILHENPDLTKPCNSHYFPNKSKPSEVECSSSAVSGLMSDTDREQNIRILLRDEKQDNHPVGTNSGNANEDIKEEASDCDLVIPETLSHNAIASAMIDEVTSDDSVVSESLETNVDCKSLISQMHAVTSTVVNLVRDVERSWLSIQQRPSSSSAESITDAPAELTKLLKYIMETVLLLEQNDFEVAVTPERRERLLTALDVVYKEMYTCFVTIAELTQIVSTDVAYLKELMNHIMKRLDTTSSSEVDSTSYALGSEQIVSRKFVDLNDIFD